MGYDVSNRGSKFFISRNFFDQAAEALRNYRRKCGYDPASDSSLAALLSDYYWIVENDENGNIIDIYLDDDRIGDDDEMFDAIAPFVQAGSYIALEGEDGFIWCFYFDGTHCTSHNAVITFPTIPNNGNGGSPRIHL